MRTFMTRRCAYDVTVLMFAHTIYIVHLIDVCAVLCYSIPQEAAFISRYIKQNFVQYLE